MYLDELLELINDNSVVRIYDSNQEELGIYDGKENIPSEYGFCTVWDIFSDKYGSKISVIGIEIDESEVQYYD